ncbi:AMP-binding enzyme [Streptomyces sp. JNUCC 64]
MVRDALPVAEPHPRDGEVPLARVVLRPGHRLTPRLESELREFVGQRLAPHNRPHRITAVPAIGRTPSGKPPRRRRASAPPPSEPVPPPSAAPSPPVVSMAPAPPPVASTTPAPAPAPPSAPSPPRSPFRPPSRPGPTSRAAPCSSPVDRAGWDGPSPPPSSGTAPRS